jgi:hypothetical protein
VTISTCSLLVLRVRTAVWICSLACLLADLTHQTCKLSQSRSLAIVSLMHDSCYAKKLLAILVVIMEPDILPCMAAPDVLF